MFGHVPRCAPSTGGSELPTRNDALGPHDFAAKLRLDRFIRFCRARGGDQQARRQTRSTDGPRVTTSVAITRTPV